MATSGSANFNRTRNEIITGALRKIGVIEQGATPSADQITEGAEVLNAIVKDLQNDGVLLWTLEWVTKVLSASDEVTGTDSLVYTCIRGHTSASDSSDKPITGGNYRSYWKQRGDTGGSWAISTAYAAIGDFEVDADTIGLEEAFMRDESGYDHPLKIIQRGDYMRISDKAQTSTYPSHICFDDKLTPKIFLWPQATDTDYVLHYLRIRMLEDFDAATNNPDMMSKWIRSLVYRLAEDLADEYGIILNERNYLSAKSQTLISRARKGDRQAPAEQFIKPAFPVR